MEKKQIFFHFYTPIFGKHFDRFFEFSHFSILTIFNDDLLPLNRVSRKNVEFHDDCLEKQKNSTSQFLSFHKFLNDWLGDFQFSYRLGRMLK